MSKQQNIDLVRDAYSAFGRGDVSVILPLLTDDVDWYLPGVEAVPMSGRIKGRSAVGEWFRLLGATEELVKFEPRQFLASDDTVVALGHYSAKVRSTGKTTSFEWVHVFTFRDDRIAKWEQYHDTAQAAEAYRETAPSETGVIATETISAKHVTPSTWPTVPKPRL